MKLFGRNLETEVAVIAEVGVNHEGDVEVARDILRAAASAGADAVKFQSYTPERFVGTGDQARFDRVTRFGLDEAAHRSLAQTATELGIIFFSAAITEDWVPLIAELSPVIKIASGDLTFEPVIRAAAAEMGAPRLPDFDLYVTLEPCAMCAGAISLARLRRLYFGAYDPKGGGVEHGARVFDQPTCHHRPEVVGGVEETAAAAVLTDFFKNRR